MLSTSLAIKLILPEVWKLSAAEQQPVQELVMDLKERYWSDDNVITFTILNSDQIYKCKDIIDNIQQTN